MNSPSFSNSTLETDPFVCEDEAFLSCCRNFTVVGFGCAAERVAIALFELSWESHRSNGPSQLHSRVLEGLSQVEWIPS